VSRNIQVMKGITSGKRRLPQRVTWNKAEVCHPLAEPIEIAKLPSHSRLQLLDLFGFEIIAAHRLMVMPMCRAATDSEADSIVEKQTKRFNRTATPPRDQPREERSAGEEEMARFFSSANADLCWMSIAER